MPIFSRFMRVRRRSDGWTDLAGNFQMDWEFDHATDGNIALTGELGLRGSREFTLGLAFGDTQHHAITTLFQRSGYSFRRASQTIHTSNGIARPRTSRSLEKISRTTATYITAVSVCFSLPEDKSYPGP